MMKSIVTGTIVLAATMAFVNATRSQEPPQRAADSGGAKRGGDAKSVEATAKSGTKPPKPHVLVTISKETTYITEPLRKDGYVNYLAALNERCKKDVTPENNAAVLFWQALGPSEIKPEMRARYFRMLGMEPPPEKGEYSIPLDKFLQRLKDAHDPRLPNATAESEDPTWDQLSQAMKRPWSKEEFPVLAAWLEANEKPLGILANASRRPREYNPMLCADSDEGAVLDSLPIQPLAQHRDAARAILARAMLLLKDGKNDDAWKDLIVCHRLARLVGQGPTLIEALVGIAIDGMAGEGDQAMLRYATINARQIAKMREELAQLPNLPKMVDKADVGERFIFLDAEGMLARKGGFNWISAISGSLKPQLTSDSPFERTLRECVDWDLILRSGNAWYDRLVAAGRTPTRRERLQLYGKIEMDIKAMQTSTSEISFWDLCMLRINPRAALSRRIGNVVTGTMLPAVTIAINAEDRRNLRFEITRLGFALAAYRADRGEYPERLNELTPRYVAKVPGDIFADDGPLHYKRQGAGYLLYSVGPNGRDDGGRGVDDGKKDESCDDIAIRVDH